MPSMPETELQTLREAERPAAASEAAARRTRRLLRAVERYKALCAAREEPPDEAESWRALLAALLAGDRSGD